MPRKKKEECIFNDAEMKVQLHSAIIENAKSNTRVSMVMEEMGRNISSQNDELVMHGGLLKKSVEVGDKNAKNTKILIRVAVVLMLVAFVAVGGGDVAAKVVDIITKIKG